MIGPLVVPALELAVKLAPVLAQAAVDVVRVLHEHVAGTPPQSSAVGLPFREVQRQREQERSATSRGTVQGPPVSLQTFGGR